MISERKWILTTFLVVGVMISLTSQAVTHRRRQVQDESELILDIHDDDKTQFLQQNTDKGVYQFGYDVGPDGIFHHENKGPDGITYGCYGYIDPNSKLIAYHYISDGWGYRTVTPGQPVEVFHHTHEHHQPSQSIDGQHEDGDHDHGHGHDGEEHEHHGEITPWEQLYFPKGCQNRVSGEVVDRPSSPVRPEISPPANQNTLVTSSNQRPTTQQSVVTSSSTQVPPVISTQSSSSPSLPVEEPDAPVQPDGLGEASGPSGQGVGYPLCDNNAESNCGDSGQAVQEENTLAPTSTTLVPERIPDYTPTEGYNPSSQPPPSEGYLPPGNHEIPSPPSQEALKPPYENEGPEENLQPQPEPEQPVDQPEEPSAPVDQPEPEQPGEPSAPVDQPEEPSAPVDRPEPEQPGEPSAPVDQPEPEQPEEPSAPVDQPEPEQPEEPSAPVDQPEPEQPEEPSAPVDQPEPEQPEEPSALVDQPEPEQPEEPSAPVDQPEQPEQPLEPVDQPEQPMPEEELPPFYPSPDISTESSNLNLPSSTESNYPTYKPPNCEVDSAQCPYPEAGVKPYPPFPPPDNVVTSNPSSQIDESVSTSDYELGSSLSPPTATDDLGSPDVDKNNNRPEQGSPCDDPLAPGCDQTSPGSNGPGNEVIAPPTDNNLPHNSDLVEPDSIHPEPSQPCGNNGANLGPCSNPPGYPPAVYIIPYPVPIVPSPQTCPCYLVSPENNTETTEQVQQAPATPPPYGVIGFIPVVFYPYCSNNENNAQSVQPIFPQAYPIGYPCQQCQNNQESNQRIQSTLRNPNFPFLPQNGLRNQPIKQHKARYTDPNLFPRVANPSYVNPNSASSSKRNTYNNFNSNNRNQVKYDNSFQQIVDQGNIKKVIKSPHRRSYYGDRTRRIQTS